MNRTPLDSSSRALRWLAASALPLLLVSGGALAAQSETPASPAPAATPEPAPAPVAMPEPAPAPPPATPEPESSLSRSLREEWASSGFGFPVTTIGTERFEGRFYEVGAFGGMGGTLAVPGLESAVGLGGVHVFENRGYVTKFTVGLLTAVAVAAAGNTEHVGSKTEQYGGYTIRTDYYRVLTPDEMAERQALPAKAFDDDYAVDLYVYAPRMPTASLLGNRHTASGFELYVGVPLLPQGKLPVIFQWGFCASYLSATGVTFLAGQGPHGDLEANATASHVEDFHYANAGLMLRLTVPVTAFAELRAQWDLNALQVFDSSELVRDGISHTSPFRLGAVINLSDRFYGSVTGTLNGLGLHGLGVGAEAGFRL